jgi:hypothetical protein
MTGITARLAFGWLVLGLALVLGTAEAQSASNLSAVDRSSAIAAGAGLPQAARSSLTAVTSDAKIRTNVRKGFLAINAANKKLYACKWGSCTEAGKTLRTASQHWLTVLRPLTTKTKTVARGLTAARTSLEYWATTGLDAVNADAAAKAKKQSTFDSWYTRYTANYKLGVKYQNRAVDILAQG